MVYMYHIFLNITLKKSWMIDLISQSLILQLYLNDLLQQIFVSYLLHFKFFLLQ